MCGCLAGRTKCPHGLQFSHPWSKRKNGKLKLRVQKDCRESKHYVTDDCYFCLVNFIGFKKKNKQHLLYPSKCNGLSAVQPISCSDKIPAPIFTKRPDIGNHRFKYSRFSSISNDEEDDIMHGKQDAY